MAFNTNPGKQSFTASANQTEFDFNFKIYEPTDIQVFKTPKDQDPNDETDKLVYPVDYTVTIDGDDGGKVILNTPSTLDDTVVLNRELPLVRDTSYVTNGDLKAVTLNADQDYQTYLIMDANVSLKSAIILPKSAVNVDIILPNVRPNSYLRWNVDGNALENDETIPDAVIAARENAWKAEADRLTANSYATEPEDVFVKIYTSNNDGTFTITNTTDYSAYHWERKANGMVNSPVYSVEVIEDLITVPVEFSVVIVKDINRGGIFVSKTEVDIDPNTGNLYTVNDGTVFAKSGGGFWVRQFSGAVNVKWFGAKGDGVTDDTVAIQNAIINYNNLILEGNYLITETIFLERETTLNGLRNEVGTFASYNTSFTYKKTIKKTTLSSSIDNIETSISLTDSSLFPNNGIVYLNGVNGEYIKYTGKSGNTLTGCTRGYYGGLNASSYSSGTEITLLEPLFMRDTSSFTGSISNIAMYNGNFVDNATGWADLGVCLYLAYAAYAVPIRESLIYGFEKAAYLGQSYVTRLDKPMIYRCRYGVQMDTANGAIISGIDSGSIGSASIPAPGWVLYFKGGNGASVFGGNIGNGSLNIPIVSDGHNNLLVEGAYVEANATHLCHAKNNGSISIHDIYCKDSSHFGIIQTGGRISIDGINYENVPYPIVYNNDDTGKWDASRLYNLNTNKVSSDIYGIGKKVFEKNNFLEIAKVYEEDKTLTNNTTTNLFKYRITTSNNISDIAVGFKLEYTYKGKWNGGVVSESGNVSIITHQRYTLSPVSNIAKSGTAQVNIGGKTLTLGFTSFVTTIIAGSRYEVTIQVTNTTDVIADSVLSYRIVPQDKRLISSQDSGYITIL